MRIDWNHERHRTRDRLLEYDEYIMPPLPHSAGLPVIYPWENTSMAILLNQLYNLAATSGYDGSVEEFKTNFGQFFSKKPVIFDITENFPDEGERDKLYFATDTNILYYFDTEYIPVNAMLIANTIINGGEA